MDSQDTTDGTPGVRRRTVVRHAAWVTPAITLGAAAPAEASSPPPLGASATWACHPGGGRRAWRYRVTVTFTNGLSCATTVQVQTLRVTVGGHRVLDRGANLTVASRSSRTLEVVTDAGTASGLGVVLLTYSYRDCGGITRAETRQIVLAPLGPCGDHDRDGAGDADEESVQVAPPSSPASPTTAPQESLPTDPPVSLTPITSTETVSPG